MAFAAPPDRREPADQLPLHLDDLQGEPGAPGRSSGSLVASRARSSSRPPPGRSSTPRARSSPSSTTRRPSGTASTRSSTMSPTAPPRCCPIAGVVTVKLDLTTRVATLVKSVDQPEGLTAPAEGNAQTARNGDLFVGWGALPYISEFSAHPGICCSTQSSRLASAPTAPPPALAPGQLGSRGHAGRPERPIRCRPYRTSRGSAVLRPL
jgi:hypothetical protein